MVFIRQDNAFKFHGVWFFGRNCDLNNEKPSNSEPISRGVSFAISSTDKKIDFTDEKSSHHSKGLTNRNFLNKVGSCSNP